MNEEFGALTLDSPELGIVPQKMDAALAAHTALFQRGVIDVLPGISTHRLTRFFAEKEPWTVMICFTLTLRSPVVF